MTHMPIRRYSQKDTEPIIAKLEERALHDLDLLFEEGDLPSFGEIQGKTAGGWLARSPRDYWWAKLFIKIFLDSPWARWSGKGFLTPFDEKEPGKGANLFQNRIRPTRYGFETYIKKSEVDKNPCLTLEYPFGSIMYGLIDDLRRIEDSVFLGQMHYKFPWSKKRLFLGYFVLCSLQPA